MANKILIITGGPIKKLEDFNDPIRKLGLDVSLASFYDLTYISDSGKRFELKVKGRDLSEFELIYIRMVGKRVEDATLLVNYAVERGLKLVDRIYESSLFLPSTISKAMEMKKLIEGGVHLPKTYFASLSVLCDIKSDKFKYPYVIKSTSGRKARDAWLVSNDAELESLYNELRPREILGDRFFAQDAVFASQRIRVLVVGGKVLGAITRPTKWRKRFLKAEGEVPEGIKEALNPVPDKYKNIALEAAKAANLDIAGIDILDEDETGEQYVIEANAAPSWKLIKKDCGVEVEAEILKYLMSL